jgi:ABC-type branched-subunit amino acid transport system ATPase component
MDVALGLPDRVIVFHQGRVLAQGSRDEIRRDARVAEIYLGSEEAEDSVTQSPSPRAE